ncbi:hypothetical protein AB0J72_42490 [Dactylosporangium sp. NPDC049742]|uniref:hypothetical protein n=1 Tax=Dactylosporangium sp. NPDC049742 TaxID=3154737 RepID=UPI003411FDAF
MDTRGRQRDLDMLRVLLHEHRDRYRTQLRLLNQPRQDGAGSTEQPALAEFTWRRLDDVEHALHALDRGRYGRCTGCGADIRIDQLIRQPAASRCPGCSRREPEPGLRSPVYTAGDRPRRERTAAPETRRPDAGGR